MAVSFAPEPSAPRHSERDFSEVNRLLLQRAHEVCRTLLPGGRRNGQEYVCGSIEGGLGRSFSVNLNDGVWKEFGGDGAGGSDLISLFAAKDGITQIEAKRQAEEWLGLESKGTSSTARAAAPNVAGAERSAPSAGSTPASPAIQDDPLWWRSVKAEARWDYFDASGAPFACVYRFRHPVTGEKAVRPWNPATNLWEAPEGKRPLLYLADLLRSTGPVVLVEGEKCADAVRAIGQTATTMMGGAQAAAVTDWTPLFGRDVIRWPDHDPAGGAWLAKTGEALRKAGAATVRDVEIPANAPPKWDAADASEDERRARITQTIGAKPVITGRPVVRLSDWTAARFTGPAPKMEWLVRDILPMGTAALLAAMGDTGKGMMTLDLALKVACGPEPVWGPVAFGATIQRFGRAIVMAAEDDAGTIHRRLERMDMSGERRAAFGERLIVVPLPNVGGARALFTSTSQGIATTDDYARLRDEILAMEDVVLVVIDPLAAFVHADLNGDAAAASFVAATFAALAADSGAAVIIAHHMRKASGNQAQRRVMTADMARESIRGSTALVDGVRTAYALWGASEDEARRELKALGEDWKGDSWVNRIVRGAVVKANANADRAVRTYLRDMRSGLLIDCTDKVRTIAIGTTEDARITLTREIAIAAESGRPYTHTGPSGVYQRRETLPGGLRELGRHKLESTIQALLESGKIVKAMAKGSTTPKWLDVPGGQFAIGEGAFDTGSAPAGEDEE